VVEEEDATRKKGDWWEYTPAIEGNVVVEARDLVGNVARANIKT
jgi:hypothetical protein